MIVVSDTSPIVALAHVELINLLELFFGTIVVPPAVTAELASGAHWAPIDVSRYPYVQVRRPSDMRRVADLRERVDVGEAEAIALAIEINAELVLIDDAAGRIVANELGLSIIGTIGVLLRAKECGRISAVGIIIDRLRQELGFFVSDRLRADALRSAGELPESIS